MNEIRENQTTNYLEQGDYCTVTKDIQNIANTIEGTGIEYLQNVTSLMQEHLKVDRNISRRYERDTQSILFDEGGKLNRDKDGKIPIGGCTESARIFRTISLAKGIPARLLETMSTDWIHLRDDKYIEEPKVYDGHVFVEVLLNGDWYVIDHMVNSKPNSENRFWIGRREGNRIKLGEGREYEIICAGIDHTNMTTIKGKSVNFKKEQDFHGFLRDKYPKRWNKTES